MKDTAKYTRIDPTELVVDGVYKTWVQEIVKILTIDKEKEKICLYNISGTHKQWVEFKNINLIAKLR